jgi:hypothetical protein
VTPPPAEDKKIGARDKEQGERGKGKGGSFSLTDDLFMESFLKPIALRNFTTPSGKDSHGMYPAG